MGDQIICSQTTMVVFENARAHDMSASLVQPTMIRIERTPTFRLANVMDDPRGGLGGAS
jgi:hypothetical protein